MFSTVVAAMQGVPQFIIDRQLNRLAKVDPVYAAEVAKALQMNITSTHDKALDLSLD